MHTDQLKTVARATLKVLAFPLLTETVSFAEAVSFDVEEIVEFSMFRPEIMKVDNLIGASGAVSDKQGEVYDLYIMYSYETMVYFLTLVYVDKTYTYDFIGKAWHTWDRRS